MGGFFSGSRKRSREGNTPVESKAVSFESFSPDLLSKALTSNGADVIQSSMGGQAQTARPHVDPHMIRDIAKRSEVVDAVLRRIVEDVMGTGYEFIPIDPEKRRSNKQLKILEGFFSKPNSDDIGDEWIENIIYDLALFNDAYIELDGNADYNQGKNDWIFGGDLQGVWHVDAATMSIYPYNQLPEPPHMAYCQKVKGIERKFAKNKIIHLSKFRRGRLYGTSPLASLLTVLAGHLYLTEYTAKLFSGNIPKTLVNVGDLSSKEMNTMLNLIEGQISQATTPYGMLVLNAGEGFEVNRLLDGTKEAQTLEMLYYFREQICSVFGIPPMKLGWVQTGKMSNPEQQLDTWYDVVESIHVRLEKVINNHILPLIKVNKWKFKFKTIRPGRDDIKSQTVMNNANAIMNLRQEMVITVNESRGMIGLPPIEEDFADDPLFRSPRLPPLYQQSTEVTGPVDGNDDDDDDVIIPDEDDDLADIQEAPWSYGKPKKPKKPKKKPMNKGEEE